MKNFTHFTNDLHKALTNKGYELNVQEVAKNNNVNLTALQFKRKGEDVGTNIYVDGFYKDYLNGVDFEEIVEEIIKIYEDNRPPFKTAYVLEQIKNKDNYSIILVNAKNNDLNGFVHRLIFDGELAEVLVARFRLNNECVHSKIPKAILSEYVSKDELFEIAYKNAKKETIEKHILDVLGWMIEFPKDVSMEELYETYPMVYISNKDRYFGAYALTNTDLLAEVSKKYFDNENIFILPSSVHECLCIKAKDLQHCKELVHTMNVTELDAMDFLSDEIFLFDVQKKTVEIAK